MLKQVQHNIVIRFWSFCRPEPGPELASASRFRVFEFSIEAPPAGRVPYLTKYLIYTIYSWADQKENPNYENRPVFSLLGLLDGGSSFSVGRQKEFGFGGVDNSCYVHDRMSDWRAYGICRYQCRN